jgi:hypothetical protein
MADKDNHDETEENKAELSFKNKIDFPANITIIKRKRKNRTFEHWYITIPVAVRKLINRNKTVNVTLEKIV